MLALKWACAPLIAGFVLAGSLFGQEALDRLESRVSGARAPARTAPDEGRIPSGATPRENRAVLGVSVVDITERTQRRFGIIVQSGAVISQVLRDGAAARAGLPLGAVVVAIDGQRVGSASDLVKQIAARKAGDDIELTYFEGDRMGRKKVTLGGITPTKTPVPSAPALPLAPPIAGAVETPRMPRSTSAGVLPAPLDDEPDGHRVDPLPAPIRSPAPSARRVRPDRPLLDRLEQALERRVAPALGPPVPTITAPSADVKTEPSAPEPVVELPPPSKPPVDEDLREQVKRMQQQIERLTREIERLEAKLRESAPDVKKKR